MAEGWQQRIKPHDYAAPEGTFVVGHMREQRHDASVPAEEKIRGSDVQDLTSEHYKTAFEFQEKMYAAFGFGSTEELRKDFDPEKPISYSPRERKSVDTHDLEEELHALSFDRKIPSYLKSQFLRALDDLKRRARWVDELLAEARAGAEYQEDMLLNCFRLVTGDTVESPNLISMTITPVSVHFICGDKETAMRITTSYDRGGGSSGMGSVRPLSPEEIKDRSDFAGMAMSRVWREGAHDVVSVGISDKKSIQRKDRAAVQDAFETFRHEFDHLLFDLRDHMHQEQDNYEIAKYVKRVQELHKQAALTGKPDERAALLLQLKKTGALLYYYSKFNKGNSAVRAANEFISQYLDAGTFNAELKLLGEYYVKEHLPHDIDAECATYMNSWITRLDAREKASTLDDLQRIEYSYKGRVLEIRRNQIQNALGACKVLEGYGITRHEIADMLRIVPFNRWAAFARRYGRDIGAWSSKRREEKADAFFASMRPEDADALVQEDSRRGEILRRMSRDLKERMRYQDTFVYYAGGMIKALTEYKDDLPGGSPEEISRNETLLEMVLYHQTRQAVGYFKKARPEYLVSAVVAQFQERNYMRGDRNSITEKAAHILARAFKDEFPQIPLSAAQLEQKMFENDRNVRS